MSLGDSYGPLDAPGTPDFSHAPGILSRHPESIQGSLRSLEACGDSLLAFGGHWSFFEVFWEASWEFSNLAARLWRSLGAFRGPETCRGCL